MVVGEVVVTDFVLVLWIVTVEVPVWLVKVVVVTERVWVCVPKLVEEEVVVVGVDVVTLFVSVDVE